MQPLSTVPCCSRNSPSGVRQYRCGVIEQGPSANAPLPIASMASMAYVERSLLIGQLISSSRAGSAIRLPYLPMRGRNGYARSTLDAA